jgi:vitamin B12 transporter
MKKIIIAALLSTFSAIALQAQTTIFGTVSTTKGERVTGANVVVEGTYDGATTDTLGRFSFKTSEKDAQHLVVTFIGCDTLKMPVLLRGGNFEANFRLKEIVNELNEVTITAGSFEASDEKKTTVLKPLDIVLTAGASADVVGALTTLPGTTRNPESGQLLVRGGAAYETRTFIDGLRVQNPYNSSVPNIPARGRFSPFLFKGTMFSTGGYSAEYGQALSSALVLNTTDVEGSNVTGLSISSVFVGASQTKKWDKAVLSATGTYTNLKPYFGMVAQRFDWVSAPQTGGGEVNFKVKTSETGILKIYSTTSFSTFTMNYPNDDDASQKSPLLLRGSNVYTNASYRDILKGDWSLFVGAAHSYNKDEIEQKFNLTTKEQSAQGRFTLGKRLSDALRVKFGAEYLNNHFNENYETPSKQTFTTIHNDNYVSAFGETDVNVSEKFVAKIGLRGEHSSLINRSNIAPRLAAAYILGKNEQISAAFGQFYQTPEHVLMRYSTNLNFERADHYMLTYQKLWSGYTLRSEIYYKNYQHLVKTGPSVNAPFSTPNNDGKGYAQDFLLVFGYKTRLSGFSNDGSTDFRFNAQRFGRLQALDFEMAHLGGCNVCVFKRSPVQRPEHDGFQRQQSSRLPRFEPNGELRDEHQRQYDDFSFYAQQCPRERTGFWLSIRQNTERNDGQNGQQSHFDGRTTLLFRRLFYLNWAEI